MDTVRTRIKCCYTGDKCPEVVFITEKEGNKNFIKIIDDFGSEIKMTQKQFDVLKSFVREGKI